MAEHTTKEKLSPWRTGRLETSQQIVAEFALWDRLLTELGLTEAEALEAVLQRNETGQPIRHFVHLQFREHYVPEDVLLAMDMGREAAEAYL
jgi:hypothetical protein